MPRVTCHMQLSFIRKRQAVTHCWIMWNKNHKILAWIFCLCSIPIYPIYALLYPASSVIQLVGSISVPVTDLSTFQKISFDWGFQMNYDMPASVSSFYNVPIWPTSRNSTSRMFKDNFIRSAGVHSRDFSLIEIYKAMELILESYGFHATCLLLGICDLMQFPFHGQEDHIISEFLTIFLRPTMHIPPTKDKLKEFGTYLSAELLGKMGLDCKKAYTNCTKNPLDLFSKINTD